MDDKELVTQYNFMIGCLAVIMTMGHFFVVLYTKESLESIDYIVPLLGLLVMKAKNV